MTKEERRRKAARQQRMRRKRRKKIRNTILLLLLLVVCTGAGIATVNILNNGIFSDYVQPYDSYQEFKTAITVSKSQRMEAFAEELCVVEENVSLEGTSLEDTQKGVLLDLTDKNVMFAKSVHEKVYPASITKIMTAMLAFKYGNMDETVTITQENVTLEEGSQVCGFAAGDRVTVRELVYSLLVYSGNDAASAIATYIGGGSMDAFVSLMNSYAKQLGCTGTHFTNPHGLHDENHYTTVYDIYLMLKEALKYPEFTEITQLSSYTLKYTRSDGTEVNTYLEATDQYLTGLSTAPKNVTVLGGKTGTTSSAGNCLALLSQNAFGEPFVSIVMGASSKDVLYQQMNSLLEHINTV